MEPKRNKKTLAYEAIKQRIIDVELPPGLPVNEEELARQLGISKTPVREALRQLERDGFVENIPSRGSTISHITAQEIHDVFEIREIIEASAAKRAALLHGNEELQRQRDALARMLQSGPPEQALEYRWGNWEDLHLAIIKSLRNETLVQVYLGLIDRILRIRNHYGRRFTVRRFQDILCEHGAILDAILSGDADGAENAMVTHLRNASAYLTGLAGGATNSLPTSVSPET